MKIVVLTRLFESVPESDTLVVDLDLCSSNEELSFRKEIEDCLSNREEFLEKPSKSTLDIVCGVNSISYRKLNFLGGDKWYKSIPVNGTICYGPTICI